MAAIDDERSTLRPLDARALGRTLRRLQRSAEAPWLHGEVARRMAERLPVIRLRPQVLLDWGAALGASEPCLASAYPRARRIPVEQEVAPAAEVPWWSPRRWSGPGSPVAAAEVAPSCAQLVWSNMALHAAIDPQAVMRQWHRALSVDGFLMFSTLGPGTLEDLAALYRRLGWPPPFAPFVDMHDLGDMLVHAGFADPVMDQETITLTWPDAPALLAELRGLGANVDPRRHPALRTPRWRQRLERALADSAGPDGRPGLRFELVFGHAFKPPPRPRLTAETTVPLADLQAMARSGRRRS